MDCGAAVFSVFVVTIMEYFGGVTLNSAGSPDSLWASWHGLTQDYNRFPDSHRISDPAHCCSGPGYNANSNNI